MNRFTRFFLLNVFCLTGLVATAQLDTIVQFKTASDTIKLKQYKVGIFAPLYLDSVFAGGTYRYAKNFPRFAQQALDFVQGAQIALDSLQLPGNSIQVRFYDTRLNNNPLSKQIINGQLDGLDLMIGAVKDEEFLDLAYFSRRKNIPFISATHPNDGGMTRNPFMIIANPTLKAHCEAIYANLLVYHGNDKLYLVRKPGGSEDIVASYFKEINSPDGKPLLNIETVNILNNDYTVLANKLDSNRNAVVVGGSLNEKFASGLAEYLSSVSSTYAVTLLGMPNWDGFKTLRKNKKLTDFAVYFTTPYFNNKWDEHSIKIKKVYLDKYKGMPSDMSYKGYEFTLRFVRLLTAHQSNLLSHLNDNNEKIFTDFFFKPIFLSPTVTVPDYFENKKLYFIKIENGELSKAW